MQITTRAVRLVAVAAAGTAVLAGVPAQAATPHDGRTAARAAVDPEPEYRGCSTPESPSGASGGAVIHNWSDPGQTLSVRLDVADIQADGRHARVRFVIEDVNGRRTYGRWRKAVGDGVYKSWWTSATSDRGIFEAGVQAATFKGNRLKTICTDM
ncbi:hypothetical protein ABT112_17690 [Streptomyces sp. NPDC002055]|uniref:hypothetical protein n=1 Tax=Streptomyces sp. NPDC002055 TaxID=3154534 RepID=UPI0033231560